MGNLGKDRGLSHHDGVTLYYSNILLLLPWGILGVTISLSGKLLLGLRGHHACSLAFSFFLGFLTQLKAPC